MNSTILPPKPDHPIIVPVDEITHVAPYFLCALPDCPCHRDPDLSGAVMREFMDGLLTVDEAFAIYWGLRS